MRAKSLTNLKSMGTGDPSLRLNCGYAQDDASRVARTNGTIHCRGEKLRNESSSISATAAPLRPFGPRRTGAIT